MNKTFLAETLETLVNIRHELPRKFTPEELETLAKFENKLWETILELEELTGITS